MRNLISTGITGRDGRRDPSRGQTLANAVRAAAFGADPACVSIADPARASAEEKIALVVGNSQYRKVTKLVNPANDSADIAASLTRLGFSVKHLKDLDFDAFRRAIIEFGTAAKSADMAVIFYAGHGAEIDGKNWLIPVDAEIKSEVNVYAEAINLEMLIDISVMPKVVGLIVLDACRNNPFIESISEGARWLPARTAPYRSQRPRTLAHRDPGRDGQGRRTPHPPSRLRMASPRSTGRQRARGIRGGRRDDGQRRRRPQQPLLGSAVAPCRNARSRNQLSVPQCPR